MVVVVVVVVVVDSNSVDGAHFKLLVGIHIASSVGFTRPLSEPKCNSTTLNVYGIWLGRRRRRRRRVGGLLWAGFVFQFLPPAAN